MPWWRTDFGEMEVRSVSEAILNEHISQGSITARFEDLIAKELKVSYAVATTSGSTALLMALMSLNISPGDEIIIPNRTWIATAHAAAMLGAKVVLVDVTPDLPIVDITQIKGKITSRTKAIMPVHLGGRIVNIHEVLAIANDYGLRVIEDAAQSLFSRGTSGHFAGTFSDAGCFSLSVAKLISSGQGGFIVTNNKETYEQLKLIRTHGVTDVINASYTQLGFNFRFTDIQASIALAQLNRAPERIDQLKRVYEKYQAGLSTLPFVKLIPVNISCGEIPLYVEVLCNNRKDLMDYLASHGIQTRPFYPNLNLADHLKNAEAFPNSRVFGECGLFLPCGPSQPLSNIDRVLDVLHSYRFLSV